MDHVFRRRRGASEGALHASSCGWGGDHDSAGGVGIAKLSRAAPEAAHLSGDRPQGLCRAHLRRQPGEGAPLVRGEHRHVRWLARADYRRCLRCLSANQQRSPMNLVSAARVGWADFIRWGAEAQGSTRPLGLMRIAIAVILFVRFGNEVSLYQGDTLAFLIL